MTLDTLRALVFRSGKSMEVLVREVEKLSALAHSRGLETLTPMEVEEVAPGVPLRMVSFARTSPLTSRTDTWRVILRPLPLTNPRLLSLSFPLVTLALW